MRPSCVSRPSASGLLLLASFLSVLISCGRATASDPQNKADEKIKEVAGSAEFLRSVPKHFATLQAVDKARHSVTLLIDGETLPKVWPLSADAEIKFCGWWGRLDQFTIADRVWLWFKTDRNKHPVAISMLADELSEQDIHGPGVTVEARTDESVTVKPVLGNSRTLQTTKAEIWRNQEKGPSKSLKVGEKLHVQSAGASARLVLDTEAFASRQLAQKASLRQRWLDEGLPGSVAFLHIFSGEMDFMLDHEAMRWGRSLKLGDKVSLQANPPIPAVVKEVRPWRERTQLRLVVHGKDQADLLPGQRLLLRMEAPSPEVENALLPPDLDLPRSKNERIEWFLASIYCTCGIKGDGCTGHFYTLASCNPNGCGMPNMARKALAEKIDKGLTDKQIFEELLREQGPNLLKQHLMP